MWSCHTAATDIHVLPPWPEMMHNFFFFCLFEKQEMVLNCAYLLWPGRFHGRWSPAAAQILHARVWIMRLLPCDCESAVVRSNVIMLQVVLNGYWALCGLGSTWAWRKSGGGMLLEAHISSSDGFVSSTKSPGPVTSNRVLLLYQITGNTSVSTENTRSTSFWDVND